ncbi:MAG: chorismate mutase [Gemmatimonadales bacterium]
MTWRRFQAVRGATTAEGLSLLCMTEIPVPGSLPRCIRVLMHLERARPGGNVEQVYLRGAVALRPDLMDSPYPSQGLA